jgi:hypothetical protein
MNNTNKKYYKRVYDKVHASDGLRERVLNMGDSHLEKDYTEGAGQRKRKKSYCRAWRVAAAVAVLAMVVPTSVYAAVQHWGIGDFFNIVNNTLTKEASELIERDVVQTEDKEGKEGMPVDFKVKEALCDRGSVSIVLEAKVKEKGKYLLVDTMSLPSDPVSNLGIKEEKTIGEYAKDKGLQLLRIGHGFADSSDFSPSTYTLDSVLEDDGTMYLYLSAEKKGDDKDLDVAVKCEAEKYSTILNFKLQDKSSSRKASYAAKEKIVLKDVKAVVTKVVVEKSDVNTYVNIYYRYPGKTEEEILQDDGGLFFRIADSIGEERLGRWSQAFFDATGGRSEGDGLYSCRLVYTGMELPEKFVLVAYDIENSEKGIIYGEFELSKIRKGE